MPNYLNIEKLERAKNALKGAATKPDSAAARIVASLDPKLSEAEKIDRVYRALGGAVSGDPASLAGIPKKKRKGPNVVNEDEVTDLKTRRSRRHKAAELDEDDDE